MITYKFLLPILFIFCNSCSEIKTEQKSPTLNTLANQKQVFNPDIMINELQLGNPESIIKNIGDLKDKIKEEESLPYVKVSNKDNSQILELILFPGSGYNDVYQFKVSYNTDKERVPSKLNDLEFITESNIKLGITKAILISIKGKGFIEDGNIIKYEITESDNPIFLQKYNLPVYYAEYIFDDNNLLTRFDFGFIYP
ncbi:MAG: hypothetical protein H3C39_09760 [Flavobacteriia bacterium]|nr:hypothetical protein [Flavobacteriia bacterium]